MPGDAEAFKRFEAEAWGRKAETYERLTGQVTGRLVGPLLDAAGVRAGQRVLDLATGTGAIAASALGRGARVVALDASEGMLRAAAERVPEAELVLGDAEELPFADESFEAVVAGCVLNHLPRPERAADGIARVLRPGGRAALTIWDRPERMRLIGLLSEAVARTGALAEDELPGVGPDPYRFADDAAFEALLVDAGLAGVRVETVAFEQRVASCEELWDGMLGGSVRTAARIESRGPEVARRIRAALEELVQPYQEAGALRIPVSAKLASGRRSATPTRSSPGASR